MLFKVVFSFSTLFLSSFNFFPIKSEESEVKVDPQCLAKSKYDFVFIHIPKAGGSTFEAMFQETKKFNQVNPRRKKVGRPVDASITPLHHTFDGLSKKYRCSSDTDSQHPKCKEISDTCIVWMTMFRDPARRFISDFYHTANRRAQNHHFSCDSGTAPKIANSLNITEFMGSNAQILKRKCSKDFQKAFNLFTAIDGRKATKELVTLAKKRIKQMHFVGILEKMDESMQLFSYTFGLDLLRYFPTFNYNGIKESVPQATISKIKEYSKVDIELYNFALAIFEERYQQMVNELAEGGKKVASFRCDRSAHSTMCWSIKGRKNALAQQNFKPIPMEDVVRITKKEKFPHHIFCSPIHGCERNSTFISL